MQFYKLLREAYEVYLTKNDEHAQAVLNFEEWCVKRETESPQ